MVSRSALEHTGQLDLWGDYIPQTETSDINNNANAHPQTCWLNQFSALKISGPDAERFLQGQLTCNMTDITTSNAIYGACCTAKGRIVANFNISFDGDNYWLILPSTSADVLEKYLHKYKVFFKANVENCQQSHLILGQWHTAEARTAVHNADQHQVTLTDNRSFIIISDNSPQEYQLSPTLNWRYADIQDGLYYVEGDHIEQWIPQHINWHHLGGISFSKGCYTGQEIIARLQYLGKAKKALYHYQGPINNPLTPEQQAAKQLLNENGKAVADILILRSQNQPQDTLNLLVVTHGENPLKTLYLGQSIDLPLTLQNLPYTIGKNE
ncbi:MAG: folate-binding protein YgfZ [Oleispira sp.]|jgi:folate-binding protein YgfZ